jgi:hypothetical protein
MVSSNDHRRSISASYISFFHFACALFPALNAFCVMLEVSLMYCFFRHGARTFETHFFTFRIALYFLQDMIQIIVLQAK